LDLVALDAARPLGNGRLLPAGPLREPARALRRANAFVLTRSESAARVAAAKRLLGRLAPGRPVLACNHRIACLVDQEGRELPLGDLAGRKLFAFCGLAGPQGFFDGLARAGLRPAGLAAFADHHFYTPEELVDLSSRATAAGAAWLVTTEKDLARLEPGALGGRALAARLELDFLDESDLSLDELLLRWLPPAGGGL